MNSHQLLGMSLQEFLNKNNVIRTFVRRPPNSLAGVVVAFVEEGKIKLGWSFRSGQGRTKFDRFTKEFALEKAIVRATNVIKAKIHSPQSQRGDVPALILPYLEYMGRRAVKYFKEAGKPFLTLQRIQEEDGEDGEFKVKEEKVL